MEELIGSQRQGRYQIESLLGRQTGRRTFLAIDTQTVDKTLTPKNDLPEKILWRSRQ